MVLELRKNSPWLHMDGVDCDVLWISVYGELTIVLNNQKEQSKDRNSCMVLWTKINKGEHLVFALV